MRLHYIAQIYLYLILGYDMYIMFQVIGFDNKSDDEHEKMKLKIKITLSGTQ